MKIMANLFSLLIDTHADIVYTEKTRYKTYNAYKGGHYVFCNTQKESQQLHPSG